MYTFILIKQAKIITKQPQKLKEIQDLGTVLTSSLHDHKAEVGENAGACWGRR